MAMLNLVSVLERSGPSRALIMFTSTVHADLLNCRANVYARTHIVPVCVLIYQTHNPSSWTRQSNLLFVLFYMYRESPLTCEIQDGCNVTGPFKGHCRRGGTEESSWRR